ncbi:unnamed protein product [Cyprideis torosa]|uniref:Uncharacterized protein n=1 Tax=Cyprideis torosa TaxID=163714 RepID=A0A7R8W840_9CRUS|nr:unnamed protein product [Cyprideis torosa]CAG0888191.1 unnamed protein product [Cyprideis torosa]
MPSEPSVLELASVFYFLWIFLTGVFLSIIRALSKMNSEEEAAVWQGVSFRGIAQISYSTNVLSDREMLKRF